ncbi:MAG: hypothetical protein KDK62_07705 [Chlamydiia bacterium]|nr:hypothetical protein [Chlamydiia bacterium]
MRLLIVLNFCVCIHLFSSCSYSSAHICEANRVIKEYSDEIEKNGFISFGSGGAFCGQVNDFNLVYFFPSEPVSIEDARYIIVSQVEKFLDKVNSDVRIKPYLVRYPFTNELVALRVNFKVKEGLALVDTFDGIVRYAIIDHGKFKDIHQEFYQEAYQKVYGRPLPQRGEDLR